MSESVEPELKRLSERDRAAWRDVIASEGPALGLFDCRVMLENKLVNDIFFEGTFKGKPCIVKCSSRAPESIANEFEMSRRLFAAEPLACAEPLALWRSPDGRRAFVVTRRLSGPSLTDMFVRGIAQDEAVDCLEDMVRIATALADSGIVWRDIIPDNLLRDSDGHLKLIDAQFAIDRAAYREDPWLLAHWKYRTLLFAFHPTVAGHGWDDVGMMLRYARYFPPNDRVKALQDRLRGLVARTVFPVACGRVDDLRMALCLVGMLIARPFASKRRRRVLRERICRAKAFLSRRRSW